MSKYMRLRKAAMLPKDEIELADADDAIVELRALLVERDRAVELLGKLVNAYGEALKAAYYPLAVVDAKGFLHELESKQ